MPHSRPSVLIIGAGFGGLAQAVELRRHGFTEVTILEAGPSIGGTWAYNSYPGSACDVPSPKYSFSYAPRTSWSRICAPQSEILRYIEEVARDEGVTPLAVTGAKVTTCAWDEADGAWTATVEDGRTFTANILVIATGQLNTPVMARVPGIETFAGEQFHSARWRHDLDLTGKRVAVIGSGASAVQFVPPVAKIAGHLDIYQRTGNWFMPRGNRPYRPAYRWAIRTIPGFQPLRRAIANQLLDHVSRSIFRPRTVGRATGLTSRAFMRWQLRGRPDLVRKAMPDYTFGCKRILFTSHFLPALKRPNVELITDGVAAVVPEGVRTVDGTVRPVDVLIHATGFATQDFMLPMDVRGRDGRVLADTWAPGASAHHGMTVPGYPSMFLMFGPNTNTSGGSILSFLEAQAAYVRQAAELLHRSRSSALDVRPEVAEASDRAIQGRFGSTAWVACNSWYRNEDGRIVSNWPGYVREYEAMVRRLDPSDFELTATGAPQPA